MHCEVIRDLLILYADDCCSKESKALVEEHLQSCQACRDALKEMRGVLTITEEPAAKPAFLARVNLWKASLLQSVLLYSCFSLLVFGVFRESITPEGGTNGLWAFALLVPVTGFLLSLANWYFLRLYPSRKAFSRFSLLFTGVFILLGDLWAVIHYQSALSGLFRCTAHTVTPFLAGIALSIALCILSPFLADRYARLSGKE